MLQQNTLSSLTGPLILNPATSVVIPATTPLQFGTVTGATSSVYGSANGALQLTASKCINLNPQVAVTIPQGIPLWLDGTCSSAIDPMYRSGFLNRANTGELVIGGAGGITMSNPPGQKIVLSTPNTPLVFGPLDLAGSPSIQGDPMNGTLNMTALNVIELTSPTTLLPPNGRIAWNPHAISNYITGGNGNKNQAGITLAGGDDDIIVQSNQHIKLGPAQSVIIPGNEPLEFPAASTSLGVILTGNNFGFTSLSATSSFVFRAGSGTTQFPSGQSVSFGDSVLPNQTIQSSGTDILNISAPQIHLNGNVVVTGGSTFLETTQLAADDPIVQLGLNLPAGDLQDRGWTAVYAERMDPLLQSTFMGWQPKMNAFALLSETHDDGTGHYVAGTWGSLQAGNMTVQSTVSARSPTGLQLAGTSVGVGPGTPFTIGNTGGGFLSDPNSIYGSTLQVLGNQLQFGSSTVQGGHNVSDPLVVQNQSGGLAVTAATLQLGVPGPLTPTLSILNGAQENTPSVAMWNHITGFQLPSTVPLQWMSSPPSSTGKTTSIVGDQTTGVVRVDATNNFYVNSPFLSGPVTWNGNPIGFQQGGTGANFTIPYAIPFVSADQSQFQETNQFTFDPTSTTITLGSLQLSTTSLLLSQTTSTFSIPQGIFQIGSSNAVVAAGGTSSFFVFGNSQFYSSLYLGGTKERFIQAGVDISSSGSSDVVIGGDALVLNNNTLIASTLTSTLQVRSPLQLDASKSLTWNGTTASITGDIASQSLILNAQHGISLPSSQMRALYWGGNYTTGETEIVSLYRSANTLNVTAPVVALTHPQATMTFGSSSGGNQISTSASSGELAISSQTSVRVNAPQIIIDGDLRVLGTTIETISNTTILDQNIFQIGQGRLLTIQSVTLYSNANNDSLLITVTSASHGLIGGEEIEIVDANAVPDVEGKYRVGSIVSANQFTIVSVQLFSTWVQNGTQGIIRAPLNLDPALDVGVQLGYFSSVTGKATNAFWVWQHSSQQFSLFSAGVLQNGIVTGTTLAPLQISQLTTSTISGFSLLGALNANQQLVSGSQFSITGGNISAVSIDYWTTSTTTVIQNLNSDYVRGLTTTDFVLCNGTQPLTSDWNAGAYQISSQFLAAKNCINTQYVSTTSNSSSSSPLFSSPVFADAITGRLLVDSQYYGYDLGTHTLCATVDVSAPLNDIIFRDSQIPGSKVGSGLAHCDTTGNAATVTNGVYTTDYSLPNSVLVSGTTPLNSPQPVSLPSNTLLGTDPTGITRALNQADIIDLIGPYINWERLEANVNFDDAPSLNLAKQLSKVCPPSSPASSPPGTTTVVYYAVLPDGNAEGQQHQIKAYHISPSYGSAAIAIQARYVSPDDSSTKGLVFLYLTNEGQSICLTWDSDVSAWYNANAGLDVFQFQYTP